MALTDTEIHRAELLLTLHYLIKYTDEHHPATVKKILESANQFGLTYVHGKEKGNDVKRQRIYDVLKYLKKLSDDYPEAFPFEIEKTEGGKYYVDKKYDLFDDQLIKILAAIKNDKYTSNKDADFLVDKILDIYSNVYNRESLLKELEELTKKTSKYDTRKLRIVSKAFNEKKLLLLRMVSYELSKEKKKFEKVFHDAWFRVYQIRELNNKPFAILLPLGKSGLVCKPAIDLPIPNLSVKELLLDDFEPDRDLNKLFKENNEKLYNVWEPTIDKIINFHKIPITSGLPLITSFYFFYHSLSKIAPRYEEFFGEKLEYKRCDISEVNKFDRARNIINVHENKDGQYCFVQTVINSNAFMSWLMSDLYTDGQRNIGELISVLEPALINREMKKRYESLFNRYNKYFDSKQETGTINDLINNPYKGRI